MRRRSISTFIGLGIGMFFVIFGIMGAGHLSSFVNYPSIFIIVGGTCGAIVTSFPPSKLRTLGPVIVKAFKGAKYNFARDIEIIAEISETSRAKGMLALENIAVEYEDEPFLHKGLLLISDGVGKDALITSMKSEIFYMQKRHKDGHAMMDMIADSVTSLGLLGTYIGLIPMLENLEDPASLGPLMAIELVSSFYGAFLSYIIFSPLSKRLKIMSSDEILRNTLLLEGLVAIAQGQSPRVIEERMLASLTKKQIARKKSKNKKETQEPISFAAREVA